MAEQPGGIELERTVDSIHVGARHRSDLGDIDTLAASIEREGLLQPITISPDGFLVCGARRLAAIKALGWKTVNVWVRSGLSDHLGLLLAEQDENTLHKPLTPLEAAALYRELKTLMAEDASRRRASTQFSTENQPGLDGPGKFPGPSGTPGETREQAAAMIPGGASYKTFDKISYLQHVADDATQPDELRARARTELERIEAGGPVDPGYTAIRTAHDTDDKPGPQELERLAQEALARVKDGQRAKKHPRPATTSGEVVRFPVRAFILTWSELAEWWMNFDLDQIADELTDEQADAFYATVAGTVAFADQLRDARHQTDKADERPRLRAI